MLSGRTALYGVVGHPVAHSRSPAMQVAAFEAAGLDALYVPLPVAPDRLAEALRGAHALGFSGLNVTVPHKKKAVAACHKVDQVALEIGAVNTLRRTEMGWEGFNTDGPALVSLLGEVGLNRRASALVIGAGGAAQAAAWALLKSGHDVRVAARREEAADELSRDAARFAREARIEPVAFHDLAREADRADVVVNATPVGLHAGESLPVAFRRSQVVVEFVYGTTVFETGARQAGARLISGEEILVRQGALAFSIWTGQTASEAVMSRAVRGEGTP